MLDSSSLGKRHEDFMQYHNKLNATLEGIADEYYGGFNNSILTFSGLYEKISSASNSVNSTKNNLIKAKKMLTEKRDGLDQLYMKSKQLSEIVLLLNRIEEINKLPSEVALNIEKKKFLTAVSQIVQAMQFLFDPELRPIEALAGLRQQLEREKENITQVMIEELHNHLYLKSPYCEKGLIFDDDSKDDFNTDPNTSRKKKDKLSKKERGGSFSYLNSETKWETSDNPETDSFSYIELIIESLLLLDKAGDAVDVTSFFYCRPFSCILYFYVCFFFFTYNS
ncbi:putative exocyst complex component sec8 [Smittium culicis]|uniref:Exocyst complex component Sec8 n=1 Tax=Smittium culicis TaxID=133412 RepID=A0A1R1YND7_9FUNG|nr:putative exocyst complex component sec8 [Smittium culicis]